MACRACGNTRIPYIWVVILSSVSLFISICIIFISIHVYIYIHTHSSRSPWKLDGISNGSHSPSSFSAALASLGSLAEASWPHLLYRRLTGLGAVTRHSEKPWLSHGFTMFYYGNWCLHPKSSYGILRHPWHPSATGPLWLNMTSQPVLDRFALLQSLHVSLESLVVPFHLFLCILIFSIDWHAPWIQPSDGYLSNKQLYT